MPEPALHFSVVFAVSAPQFGVRRALPLSALALLPDVDVLFGVHRSMSHSAVLVALAFLPALLAAALAGRRRLGLAAACFAAVLSHLALDCFQSYTPLLYPLCGESFWVDVAGAVSISGGGLVPQLSAALRSIPTEFAAFEFMDAPLFTREGFLASAMLVAVPLASALRRVRVGGVAAGGGFPVGLMVMDGGLRLEAVDPGVRASKDLVTVVIPTFNEEEGIGSVIDELRAEGYRNILVVDGYSTDRTVEVARSKGVEVVYQSGFGKAGAVATAIGLVSTPYVVFMDGDGTYDPKDIEALLRHAGGYDEVIGLRSQRENIPLLHRFGNRVISSVFSLMLGRRVRDPCSGMYLLRSDFARRLEISSSGFDVEVEIAAQAASFGRIFEVPVRYRRRLGRGKLRACRDGFRILASTVKMMWLYNPVFLASLIVALLAFPGAAILLEQLVTRYLYGSWSLGWSWVGLVLFVAGLQGLAVAAISVMLRGMERRLISMLEEARRER
ncbi:MAG: glycosyltransferase [Candidatus Nezhaarchaeales archaeon]